ncbi:MAG: ABC transporter permease [Hyphomicrobiaceae bacterium]
MILTLATRNLFYDRIRLAVTLVGILFSIVLVAVQLGLYLGARKTIVGMIDHANADLWVVTYGAKSFEESQLQSGRQRYVALAVPGVQSVTPLVVSFVRWRKPEGGLVLSVLVGTDIADGGLEPWNVVEGRSASLREPDAIGVDRTYFKSLGIKGIGDTAELLGHRVRVATVTEGIRSFTMSPYLWTTTDRARQMIKATGDEATFYLVKVRPGVDIEAVRRDIQAATDDTEVLTVAEFRDRSLRHWLFGTGAGVALIGGAVLGLLVGTVIVAQTLYSSTKDHLTEFATLRALGSSTGYIRKVIMAQAGLSAVLGYVLGMSIAMLVVLASQSSALPIVMTAELALVLFLLTLSMCMISAISAIFKVTRLDPAMVFSR